MRRKTLLAAEAAATSSDEDDSSSDSGGGTLLRKCIRLTPGGNESKTPSDRNRFSDQEVVRHVKT